MFILDRYEAADVPAPRLEEFIWNHELVSAVEEHLTYADQDELLIEFLKLQQDCGVQVSVARTLAGTNLSLAGGVEPSLRYGLDNNVPSPGEHTERTFMAYETVTLSRLNTLLPRIHAHLTDVALAHEFKTSLEDLGIVSYPTHSAAALPPPFPF